MVARSGIFGPSFLGLGWLHLVALGWITLVALSVLVHVIPEFSDVAWRGADVARWSVASYAVGVIVLLGGFFGDNLVALEIGATLAAVAVSVYVVLAIATLAHALPGERRARAVARAFSLTLSCLLLTAVLGSIFTYALGGHLPAGELDRLPRVHALLGIGGWLTLLVMGVSARTLRPITGVATRMPALHVIASSLVALGSLGAAAAFIYALFPLATLCLAILLLGSLAYAVDIADIVARATVAHGAPHVLMLSAVCFAVAAATLALCASLGLPTGNAAVYAALVGWIGSAIVAHLHHIGVRVLLTSTRGEDDETRPWEVLTAPLTWTCVVFYEGAAAVGVIGILLGSSALLEIAAASGLLSFVAMMSNLIAARRNAMR
jgi:hypothetical protein